MGIFSTIQGCTAGSNEGDGISISRDTLARDNTFDSNGIERRWRGDISNAGTFTATTGIGFDVGGGTTIEGCTAVFNRGDGIRLGSSSLARDNNCAFTGSSGDGAGIHTHAPLLLNLPDVLLFDQRGIRHK